MIQTYEAVASESGDIRLLQDLKLASPRRALVTILDESPDSTIEVTLLSEAALAEDWNRPEEDAAWAPFQRGA
jgi:hypothetical protein